MTSSLLMVDLHFDLELDLSDQEFDLKLSWWVFVLQNSSCAAWNQEMKPFQLTSSQVMFDLYLDLDFDLNQCIIESLFIFIFILIFIFENSILDKFWILFNQIYIFWLIEKELTTKSQNKTLKTQEFGGFFKSNLHFWEIIDKEYYKNYISKSVY